MLISKEDDFFFFNFKELHFVFQFLVFSLHVMKTSKKRKIEFVLPLEELNSKVRKIILP